jgi:hypothetical protein
MPNPTDKFNTGVAFPETDSFKEAQSNVLESKYNPLYGDMSQSVDDFAKSISHGESISDLINQTEATQSKTEDLLKNYNPAVPKTAFSGGGSESDVYNKLYSAINPSTPTLKARNVPYGLGSQSEFERYSQSNDFEQFGFTPNLGSEQEYKYGRAMGWGETIGKALGGGAHLAADTFIEGWKGWGRMAEALFTWDSSKLMGSEEERYKMAKEQEDIMNKYAIYDTETSADGIFNRQFFGTMLQQSGFAVGAGLQFAMEEFLTGGLATFAQPLLKGSMVARGVKNLEKAEDLINTTRKVMDTVTKQERIVKSIADGAKRLVPLYGTAEEMSKMYKAGAGYLQLGMTLGGGIKRGLSEFNMARSESIYEAAGTYKQLKDRLVQEYVEANGKAPQGDDLEKIKQTAEDASHDNFWTNVGVLSVMNRIQFDNVFKGFSKSRSILGEGLAELEGQAFSVTGKVAGKTETRAFKKGILGEFGAFGDVAKVFGKKEAAWAAAKSVGKGLMKFEGSEGMQELIQNASSTGLQDYYYDLYHGKKGYTGKLDATLSSMQNPLTDTEGMKTFLMGALTGRLIAPMTLGISKGQEAISNLKNKKNDPNYQTRAAKAEESIKMLNAFYADPSQFKKEWIASVKVNNKAAETMDEAAKNHNRYVFYNHKDSAFAKTVASAIKLDMFDSMRDVLKEYGNEMNDEEFKQAFGIEATADNKKNVKNLTGTIVNQMESYHTIYHNLMDKYGDRVLPELYKNNEPDRYIQALQSKKALQDAIELLATNTYKSQQTVVRASSLQTEIGSNKNIGSSSLEVLTKMGSEEALDDHINLLSQEIKSMEGADLTPDGKELLKNKKEELKLANKWKDAYSELVDNTDESRSPVTEGRAYSAFADLVNVFNKRNKLSTSISKEDVDDVFVKINDYIRLNKDNKSYVDAMNLLADPNNINLVTRAMYDAIGDMGKTFKEEHKEEIKEAVGKEDELDADDLEKMAKEFEVPEEEPELEEFLKKEYDRIKGSLKDDQTIPDYETWKEGPGKFVAERFKKQKEKEQKKKETKPPTTESGTRGHYKVNGRIITMEGIPGSIDFTGAAKGSDLSAMPEITKIVSTWDNEFVKERLVNFNGQFIFNQNGRVCVLVEVGKFIVPYYFSSSGTSGKTIDWHYIFGVDDLNGWLIKGSVDEKGEMEYSSKMKSTYPKAIAELEKIKKEIREKLPMTEDQKNTVAGQLSTKNKELSKKYNKSLSDIYKDLDVVAGRGPDGVVTNENYHWLLANTLALTGLDAKIQTKTLTADAKKAILIDAKPAHFTETREKEGGIVEMDYIYDVPEGVSQTEEEYENSKGTLTINTKTKVVTDASGKVVILSTPTKKTEDPEPPPPPTPDDKDNVIKNYTVKKDEATSKWYVIDQNGKTVAKDFNTALDASNYVNTLSGFREAKIAEFQKKIDEVQKKIDEFPNDGVIVNGDVITFDQKYVDLENELKNLKERKAAFEKEIIYGEKEVNELVDEIKSTKLVKEAYDNIVDKVNRIIDKLSDAYKKVVNRALADKKAEIDKAELDASEGGKKGFSYEDLKVGQVINIISKYDPSVIGTLTVSSIEKPDFVRFDMNFSNGFQEDGIGYSQKEFNELFTVVEKPDEEQIEIEPEYESGDYKKAYALGRAVAQGKDVNLPENQSLLVNYPKLIKAAQKIEEAREKELEQNPEFSVEIDDMYDQKAKDLIDSGKPFPEDFDKTGENNVPATAQMLDRNRLAQMKTDTLYAGASFQEGYRQIYPSTSLANTTDFVKVDNKAGTLEYVRNGVNPNYVFDVATREFMPGTIISYRVMTADEDYDNMSANRITGKKYKKSDIFDANGKVIKKMYYETPIQIIATIRGKETVIGHVREPLWIQHKIGDKYANIATPEGMDATKHVENEMKINMKLRDLILDTYNKNSKFVITGIVSDKSNGILKMGDSTGFLKDRIDPRIGEGGSNNEHGYFAIVRNGRLETDINDEAKNVIETVSFTKNVDRLSGVPALMLPSPTGKFMPTFIGLPKVDKGQAEFIIEAWKAFTGQSENPELVAAVYKTLNRIMSGKTPSIGVLRDYINQYVTTLEHSDMLDKLGTGNGVAPGSARLNIYDDGNLGIEVKDDIEVKNGKKTNEWFNNGNRPIRKASELPENIISLLQNLRMTIKFNDRKNDDLIGINNKNKIDFLSMKDGKLVTKKMTYNQYVMEKATTFVEKGTESENTNKDWVYFANPVIPLTHNKPGDIEGDIFNKEETPPPTLKEVDGPKEDKATALLAAIRAKKLSPEQVEEKKNDCLQNRINNIL